MSGPTDKKLFAFITKAGQNTYPVKPPEPSPERDGFLDITFDNGEFTYRDSFVAGKTKSAGTELVRFKGNPIWYSNYGGGVVDAHAKLGREAIAFLKKAFVARDMKPHFQSFRGPKLLRKGDWLYTYKQVGDVVEFHGYEEIRYKGELVFYHRVFGGRIK